jgi:hypothetical protein
MRSRPIGWKPPPLLKPWERAILQVVIARPGLTSQEVGDRYFPFGRKEIRERAAHHELRRLERNNLVQRHLRTWSPSLMAAEVLARDARMARSP